MTPSSPTGRPSIGRVCNPDSIPAALKQLDRWAPWRADWIPDKQKWSKVPCTLDGHGLSSARPDRWYSIGDALNAYRRNRTRFAGIGLVLTDLPGMIGIDLDHCVDTDGVLAEWAQKIVDSVDSYTEYSPSRTGVRVFAQGAIPSDAIDHATGVEIYGGHRARFLTVTGDVVNARPLRRVPDDVLLPLHAAHNIPRKSADIIDLAIPPLIAEIMLPMAEDLDLPEHLSELMGCGAPAGADRSALLAELGGALHQLGHTDAEIISILAANDHVMAIALDKRGDDADRALGYLWREHVLKTRGKHPDRRQVAAMFEDVSNDPEAVQAAAQAEQKARARTEKAEDRFRLKSLAEFSVMAEQDWIVDDVIPKGQLGVVYGASGSGKSFWLLDVMASIASGSPWQGRSTAKTGVCWIAAEGVDDMRKRVVALCQSRGIELGAGREQLDIQFVDEGPNFLEEIDIKALIKQIKARGPVGAVVVDTLAQVMPGGNENSGEDIGRVLGYCKAISRATGAIVILCHHSGKDATRGARGWSGLRAAADFEIEIIRADDDRVATVTKLKGGRDGAEFGFSLDVVSVGRDTRGKPRETCIVRHTGAQKAQIEHIQQHGKYATLALNHLSWHGATAESTIAKLIFDAMPTPQPDKRDYRDKNSKDEIRDLVASKLIVRDDKGVLKVTEKGRRPMPETLFAEKSTEMFDEVAYDEPAKNSCV